MLRCKKGLMKTVSKIANNYQGLLDRFWATTSCVHLIPSFEDARERLKRDFVILKLLQASLEMFSLK